MLRLRSTAQWPPGSALSWPQLLRQPQTRRAREQINKCSQALRGIPQARRLRLWRVAALMNAYVNVSLSLFCWFVARADMVACRSATPAKAYVGKKAVVVGAGPAGACAAMFLAEQGFTVEVRLPARAPPAGVGGGVALNTAVRPPPHYDFLTGPCNQPFSDMGSTSDGPLPV